MVKQTQRPLPGSHPIWPQLILILQTFWLPLGTIALGAGLLLGYVPGLPWPLLLLPHFRVQMALLLIVGVALLLWRRDWAMAGLLLLPLLVVAFSLLPYWTETAVAAPDSTPTYRALSLNVLQGNDDYTAVADLITVTDPDIIVLVEVTSKWNWALAPVLAAYPYHHSAKAPDDTARLVVSRLPLDSVETIADPERPSAVMQLRVDGQPLTLVGVHLDSPLKLKTVADPPRELAGLTRFLRQNEAPALLLGDFNQTPWHPDFRIFLQQSGLRDGRVGFGLLPSWKPPHVPFMSLSGLPIDHALTTPGITILNLQTGPNVGSDHLPLIVDFALTTE